jgi:hypothetical protein
VTFEGGFGFAFGRSFTRKVAAMIELRTESSIDFQRDRLVLVNAGSIDGVRNVVVHANIGHSVFSDDGGHFYAGGGFKVDQGGSRACYPRQPWARDIRFALRRLGATPLFTIFAILSLAVGVAITTAVYSIVDAVFLSGLGIHEPDRVAVIVTPYSGRLLTGTVSEPDFRDVQTAQTSFSHVAASATFVRRLALPSATEMVIGESVSGSYFATLGVGAKLGRTIQPSDDAGGERVVMLSDTLWRRRFASDPRIVGATVAISGEPFEIIGVAPASFSGPRGWLVGTQFWIPLGTESRLKESPRTAAPRATARDDRRLTVFGRLATEVTIAAASAEMQTIAERLDEFFPPRFRGKGVGATDRPWRAKTMAAISDDEDSAVRRFGMTLVALVGLVLVVACTNLGNLVLARGSTTAARARRAARPRRIEVAARARTVSRERDAGGRRRIRVLRHVRAVARRDGHRVQPRHAFRRPYHAVVSSRAERAGADGRGLVAPHRAGRLRPRAGDSADAHARRSRRARRRIGRRTAARPAPAASPAVAGRHRGRVLHHRYHVREVLDRGGAP